MLRKKDIVVNRLGNTPPEQGKFKGLLSEGLRSFVSLAQSPLRLTCIPLLFTALLLTATSCETDGSGHDGEGMTIQLDIQTRAAASDNETYEVGSTWENYIDIDGGDYRIYFFTYDQTSPSDAAKNNILIDEFKPYDIYSTDSGVYTTYRATGTVDPSMAEHDSFKVVMLANWGDGNYPSVTNGSTTIDDVCNAGTFDAFVENNTALMPSETLHIPFYGVREYTGVTWRNGWRTVLNGDVTLLRAVAKVEIILTEDSVIDGFDGISMHKYNPTGYCAPSGVYLRSDYDSNYEDWSRDFTSAVHIVGGANSGGDNYAAFVKSDTSEGLEKWTGYFPEYANTNSDYSYIQADYGGRSGSEDSRIFFSNYENGSTTRYSDYDVSRNYLYRFYVTVSSSGFNVSIRNWDDEYDNTFNF